jgi:uncharacterized Fe-S cluster-containing radical SAM superfamily protein
VSARAYESMNSSPAPVTTSKCSVASVARRLPATLADPDLAPPPDAPALGSRLWLYTNFNCNLACDYCCAESSPRAHARGLPVDVAARAVEEFAGLGGRDVLLTGGEPFLNPDLGALCEAAGRFLPVTVLTNAMVFSRGSRRRMLEGLSRDQVRMQVSLDSGTPELHDRHRGAGSFDRALAGIALLRELGFTVRVAATIDEADAAEEAGLHRLLDEEGIPERDRLVRRVARTGFAHWGLSLSVETLWPEPALTADGAWWHPVAVTDAAMQVSSAPLPVVTVLAVIRATLTDDSRDRSAALEAFRCT